MLHMEIHNQIPVKEPKITGRKPKWTQEFMMMVGREVCEGGMTLRAAAKTFGMSHGTVSVCRKRFKRGDWRGNGQKVKQNEERYRVQRLEQQIKEIKQEVGELYLENLMLKKALQFSQQVKRENSSVITSDTLDRLPKAAE
jgi:transposase-like protein